MEEKKEIRAIPKVELLFEENIEAFNRMAMQGEPPDLTNSNLSGLDLRKARLKGLDLSGCYMRNVDLRGMDLSECNFQGASLQGALISGALFPENVPVDELKLSVKYGTRIRTSDLQRNVRKLMVLLSEVYAFLLDKANK